MNTELRILILEDAPEDAELIKRQLSEGKLQFTARTVDNKRDFLKELKEFKPDIILSDYSLPQFTGLEALDIVKEIAPSTPFIIITGTINEETAVSCIKAGAWDYIIKDRLVRLGAAVKSALELKEERFKKEQVLQALRESERELKEAQRIGRIGHWEFNLATGQISWSDMIFALYKRDPKLGPPTTEEEAAYYSPEDAERLRNCARIAIETGKPYETDVTAKLTGGRIAYFTAAGKPVKDANGRVIKLLGTVQDITDRKRAEEARIRLETAIEHAGDIVVITDVDGTIQYVNPAFEQITGYSREEAIGQNPRILKSGKHDEAFYKTMWDTILSGKVWKGNLINKKKDGTFYEEKVSISPIRKKNGSITNFVAVKRDVTDEVKMEQRLLQSQKIEAIGTLAGGIAHDFNNILSAIIGYTELSMDEVSEGSQVRSDLEKIYKAGYRARDLVNQILTFSRQREQEKRPIQIDSIIKETLKLLRACLPTTIEIRQNIESEVGTVLADPTQIHQVVMNLCTNAGHAMSEKGGILDVSLGNVELDADFAYLHPGIIPGPYLKLRVCDTGRGMKPEVLKRIFEPYFTTKEKSGGTGLGLAVVHGIVNSYNGTITVYSEPGRGTNFHVYLPIIQEEPVEEIEKNEISFTGHERILFVDDEQDLVDVGKRILEGLGYRVTTVTHSLDALDIFRKNPDQFDLVITDMTMPFMTGDELAGEIMRIRPGIPIILCSGYSEKISEEKALSKGIRAYLGKPLLKSEIARTVRRVLDQDSGDR